MPTKKSVRKPPVQYGAGPNIKGGRKATARLGLKDRAELRNIQKNFRVTEKEYAIIDGDFKAHGGERSFAEYASGLMLEAIAARSRGIEMLESQNEATAREVHGLAKELRQGTAPMIEQVLGLQKRVGAGAVVLQKEQRAVQAQVDQLTGEVRQLFAQLGSMAEAFVAMGEKLDGGLGAVAGALGRVDEEVAHRAPAGRTHAVARAKRVS